MLNRPRRSIVAGIAAPVIVLLFGVSGGASGEPSVPPARVTTLIQAELKVVVNRSGQSVTKLVCRAPSTGVTPPTITSEYRCTYLSAGFEWTCGVKPGALALAGVESPTDVRAYVCTHPR